MPCLSFLAQLKPKEKTEEEIETEKLQMYQIRKHVLPEINVPLHDIDWPESGRGSKRRTPIDPKYNESKQVHINETNNHDREQNTVLPDITKVDNLVRRHTDMLENGSKSKRATTSAKEKRRSKSQMDSVNNNDLLGGEEASKQKAHRKSKTEGNSLDRKCRILDTKTPSYIFATEHIRNLFLLLAPCTAQNAKSIIVNWDNRHPHNINNVIHFRG